MPATAKGKSNEQYVDYDEFIDFHLNKVRSNVKTTDLLTAIVGVATMVLAYLLVFVVCDHWVIAGGFDRTARLAMLGVLAVGAVGWIGWKVVLPARRRVNALYAADTIEKASPDLLGNLRNLVDVRSAGRKPSVDIARTMERRAATTMSKFDVDTAVDRRRLTQTTYALLVVVVLACAYTIFSPKRISNSIWRALMPTADVAVPTRTEILTVDPGDAEIVARSRLDVTVDLAGEEPEAVSLLYTTADERFVDEPLTMRESTEFPKRYTATIVGENGKGILQDLDYRVVAGDAESKAFHVTVLQPPSATVEKVEVVYPEYTGLEPKTRLGGHVDALEGSAVAWHATTNQKVERAVVQFSDEEVFTGKGEEIRMDVGPDGRRLTATIDPWKKRIDKSVPPFPKFYRVQVWNAKGATDPEPIVHTVDVELDLPPDVALVDPREDLVGPRARPANGSVPLAILAKDDFGLRYVSLVVRRAGQRVHAEPIFEGDTRYYDPKKPYVFELHQPGRLELKTGDTIELVVRAKDNKQPNAQATDTPPLLVEIGEPATDEELDRQRKEDAQRREERLDELPQEPNQDGAGEGQPQDAGEQDGEAEPQPGEKPSDAQQPGEGDMGEGDPQNGEGAKNEQPGEGSGRGDPMQGGDQQGGDQQAGEQLPQDGTRDDEATQKLIEHANRQRREQEQNGDGQDDSKQPTEIKPKDETEPGQEPGDEKKPGEQGDQPQPSEEEQGTGGNQGGESAPMPPKGADDGNANGGEPMPGGADGEKPMTPEPGAGEPSEGEPMDDDTKPGDPMGGKQEPADPDAGDTKPGDAENGTKSPGDPKDETEPGEASGGTERKSAPKPGDPNAADAKPGDPNEKPNGAERKAPQPGDPPNGEKTPSDGQPGEKKPDDEPKTGETKPKPADDPRGEKTDDPTTEPADSEKNPPNAAEPQPGEPPTGDPKNGGQPSGDPTKPEPNGGKPMPGEKPMGDQKQPGDPNAGEQPGGQKPGEQGQPGQQPGEGQQGEPKPGDQPGEAQPGDQQGSDSSKPGEQGGESSGGDTPTGGSEGSGRGEAAPDKPLAEPERPSEAEDARKATELVLKRLEEQLERGEVDENLRKELGWGEEEMRNYVDRMKKRMELLDQQADGPETAAQKRQFQEMLESLDFKSAGETRKARTDRRRAIDSFGGREVPPPPEYGEAFEAFSRDLPELLRRKPSRRSEK